MYSGKYPSHEELVDRLYSLDPGNMEKRVEIGLKTPVYIPGGVTKVAPLEIDVVWKILSGITLIIEVKPWLDVRAIGQAITYREMYSEKYSGEKVESAILYGRSSDCQRGDILEVAKRYVDLVGNIAHFAWAGKYYDGSNKPMTLKPKWKIPGLK